MTIIPHNHLMWAMIGVYTGREDNIFWRRAQEDAGARVEAAGAKSLGERGRRAARTGHHPFGDEPAVTSDGRHPRL